MTASRRPRSLTQPACLMLLGLLASATVAAHANAELLEVRQVAGGMECAECARTLQLRVKALPGIDVAAASWNRRVLSARLLPGNHATLAQIRALVLAQHFQIRDAQIIVAGRLEPVAAGAMSLRVPESSVVYRIDLGGMSKADGDGWRIRLADAAAAGARVVITGLVPGAPGGEDPQTLSPILLETRAPKS
jgi:hypothetical protein